jgi:hypothetical protein
VVGYPTIHLSKIDNTQSPRIPILGLFVARIHLPLLISSPVHERGSLTPNRSALEDRHERSPRTHPTRTCRDEVVPAIKAAQAALDACHGLYMRILSDLAQRAEQMEDALGLPPLPEPPEEEDS